MRLIDADELTNIIKKWLPKDPCGREELEHPYEEDICVSTLMTIEEQPTIDAIPRETVFDFKTKLDKWMFHNHESVCGQRMIDIDYLEGEIWELFQELGIVRYDDDGNLIDEVSKE